MTLYFGETLTPDYAGNWATFGGPSPSDDRNVSSIYSGVDAGLGAFTTTTAIVITELSRSFEDAIGNAGGTVSIGVLDITGGTAEAILLGSATINLIAIGTGNYIWHTVSGLSISVPSGRTIAIVSGKPSLQVWSTRSGTVFSEYITPATLTLPSTWTATGSNARAVPLRAGYDLVASVQIDDINTNEQVRVNSTGNTITTTGLATLTSLTIGGKSATSISATGGDGTFSMPAFSDGVAYSLMGTATATAGDGTNTANLSVSLLPMTGWNYVTLSGTLNTTTTGVLNSFSPAAVVTDQIVFETANGSVDAQGNYTGDYDGTQTMWHIKASDGVARSYSVVTGVVGLSVTLTGVSATANVGTISATLGGAGLSTTLTGVATTASVGSITATISAYVIGTAIDSLPKFLKDAVKAFRKPFSKSFRKR